MNTPMLCRRLGFTLVELLVVVAIIGILMAIMFPVVSSVRNSASKAVATSNFRQIGIAVALYASDHRGQLPGPAQSGTSWQFLTGQQALCGTGWPSYRPYLCTPSPTSIGSYLGGSMHMAVIPGYGNCYVCDLFLTPAFKDRTGNAYPNDKIYLLGNSVDGQYAPFGSSSAPAMTINAISRSFDIGNRYMLREGLANSITTPIHGNGYVTLFFDGHVAFVPVGSTTILNNSNTGS